MTAACPQVGIVTTNIKADSGTGAGILDQVISIEELNGLYCIEVSNSSFFYIGQVAYVGKLDEYAGSFVVRAISDPRSGQYLWTEKLPSIAVNDYIAVSDFRASSPNKGAL